MKYLVFFFLLASCKAVKTNTAKQLISKTEVTTNTVIQPAVVNELTATLLCDKITNTVQDLKYVYVTNNDTTYIEVVDNELIISLKKESQILKKERDSIFSAIGNTNTVRTITITSYTPYYITGILIVILLLLSYLKTVNKLNINSLTSLIKSLWKK